LGVHNFGSGYAKKTIKGSEDSDHSLDSKKNLNQKMARWVGAQAQVTSVKKTQSTPTCDVSHREFWTQNWKKISIETRRLPDLYRLGGYGRKCTGHHC